MLQTRLAVNLARNLNVELVEDAEGYGLEFTALQTLSLSRGKLAGGCYSVDPQSNSPNLNFSSALSYMWA